MMEKGKLLIIAVIVLAILCAFLGGYVIALSGAQGQPVPVQNAASTAPVPAQEPAPDAATSKAQSEAMVASATQNMPAQGEGIGEEKAKSNALAHAKLTEKDVTFGKVKLDNENGRAVYEIEFYQGGAQYDYTIDANTGDVVAYEYDVQRTQTAGQNGGAQTLLGEAKAQSIALEHAGFAENEVTLGRVRLDLEDGVTVYKVKFRDGLVAYEYEIHAENGGIVSYSMGD